MAGSMAAMGEDPLPKEWEPQSEGLELKKVCFRCLVWFI